MYKILIKPFLFRFVPETAHKIVFTSLKLIQNLNLNFLLKIIYHYKNNELEREVFGIKFPNPIGLAAGLDKDAEVFEALGNIGFGFVEIGTVTPKAQPGNPKPRAFRLIEDEGLINRMGFNNEGLEACVNRLKKRKSKIIIGGNIGKNKITPNEEAISDYEKGFNALFSWVDYFVVNVSSPNTPNLRALQDKEPLTKLLSHLMALNKQKSLPKPILLKIAPDLTNEQLDDIIEIVKTTGIDGIVATNTTIARNHLKTDSKIIENIGAGGLSGKPLTKRSTEVIKYLHTKSNGSIPIIGVGGIHTPEDAIEKLEAGASLIQLYTGFIYEGPGIVKKINKSLINL
ncbi:MAG: quinone-dependent dihydroorotate dehydrogenase [Bacteroidales bacterium]|nr:quinone-dependent dihydroorotate dehydrogenase [Bacteroidales bacterium]